MIFQRYLNLTYLFLDISSSSSSSSSSEEQAPAPEATPAPVPAGPSFVFDHQPKKLVQYERASFTVTLANELLGAPFVVCTMMNFLLCTNFVFSRRC